MPNELPEHNFKPWIFNENGREITLLFCMPVKK